MVRTLIIDNNQQLLSLGNDFQKLEIQDGIELSMIWNPLQSPLTEISIASNAKVHILCVYDRNFVGKLDLNTKVFVTDNAFFQITQVYFGATVAKINFHTVIGNNAKANIYAIYFANRTQDFDFQIKSEFVGRDCCGETIVRGVALDSANVTVDGVIEIDQNAINSDAKLSEKGLLLSKKATIRNLPVLKINTDNTRASHNASVAKINENDLFYLESRGLDKNLSSRLIIDSFLANVYRKDKIFEGYFCTVEKEIEAKIMNMC